MTQRPIHTARLHEATVIEAASHADAFTERRTRGKDRRPRSSAVTTVKVHPAVWKAAVRQAGGDLSRLTIVDGGTVLVR